jgi:hypothetical protein
MEAEVDPGLRSYLDQNGEPDYLLVDSTYVVHFIYVEKDIVVDFHRDWYGKIPMWSYPATKEAPTVRQGIPPSLVTRMTSEDQDRLAARRAGR